MPFLPQSILLSLTDLSSTTINSLCFLTYLLFVFLACFWRADSFSFFFFLIKKQPSSNAPAVIFFISCTELLTQFKVPPTGAQRLLSGLTQCVRTLVLCQGHMMSNIMLACLLEHNMQCSTMPCVSFCPDSNNPIDTKCINASGQ